MKPLLSNDLLKLCSQTARWSTFFLRHSVQLESGRTVLLQFACLDATSVELSAATDNASAEFLSTVRRRRQRIQRICNDTGNTLRSRVINATSILRDLGFTRSLFFDTERRLVYCAAAKVASSTVKMAMALMTGRFDFARPINEHDSSYMARVGLTSLQRRLATGDNATWPELVQKLERMRKFIIIRHPLERVVSAYRDKFERINEYFHNKYGKLIISR